MSLLARFRQGIIRTLNLRQAVRLVYHASPRLFAGGMALVVIQSILPVAILYATKLMIDNITEQITRPAADREFSSVLTLIAIVGAVTLIDAFFGTIAALVSDIQAEVVSDRVMSHIHTKSVAVDLAYYENAQVYDTMHRAQQDAPYRPPRIVNGLLRIGQSALSLVGMLALLASLNLVIALIVFVAALPRLFVRLWSSRVLHRWLTRRAATERMLQYLNWILMLSDYAKEVRLFNLGGLFSARYDATRAGLRREKIAISTRRAGMDFAAQSVSVIALFAAYALIANDALIGGITIGSLVISFQAFQRAQGYFSDILSALAMLYEDNLFLTNYTQFMELESGIAVPAQPQAMPAVMRDGLRFENVSFQYSSGDRPILDGISFHLKPGETIALVGNNGAGKTTLVKLLCRLYDPTGGRITLDGVDIREFDPTEYRRLLGVIFQDYVTYQAPAWENIWVGDVDADVDRAKIEVAARKSEAHAVIETLSKGYDTILGDWFEGARQLSVGQWQKVGLGRAFFRDAQVMILDEPTAALDVLTEAAVFDHFRQIAQGKTAVLISHRLSTVRMADRILVLQEGKIIEQGSHDVLMHQNGVYAGLFRTQAQNYVMTDALDTADTTS